ncbi:phage tail tube protein [Streptomyces harbinensis]|uniref:phage tail tube protein n=1 Tax=Streptomyces harbinensis TaxID=1176198 RepID=UPI0036AFB0CF
MADVIVDGRTRVAWATSIANISAPTVAELEAAVDLTTRITPDGLGITPETATVDTSNLASTFTTNRAGRRSYSNELTFKRGTTPADDAPHTTLKYKTVGYLIVRRTLEYEEPWEVGQEVEVYPIECGEPQQIPPAPNEVAKFTSPMMVTDDPDTAAVVA